MAHGHRESFRSGTFLLVACAVALASCRQAPSGDPEEAASRLLAPSLADADATISSGAEGAVAFTPIASPILFVAQVPVPGGGPFASRLQVFANHIPVMDAVPRGGDLMIRYPDGTLRNLTKEAGFGMEGLQTDKAIAVREPTVHWDGTKAIFSMLVGGSPKRYEHPKSKWQLYEIHGLARGQTAVITKVPHQPANYNNVSPLYASDDRILFTSDRAFNGMSHLHPHLDEYESTPTITGIYSLDPATGALSMLNHTPSGAFSPTIDSYGRIIFTRWDHLQRDQGADGGTFGAHNFVSEEAGAARTVGHPETFPEPRGNSGSDYGPVNGYRNNLFAPWQMNQDGSEELTLNHIGRHELSFRVLHRSFASDSSMADTANMSLFANRREVGMDKGLFHLREDPLNPGIYFGIYAHEFEEGTTGPIQRITGAPSLNAEQMTVTDVSPPPSPAGRFRNPLPTTTGAMVASYSSNPVFGPDSTLRLHQLTVNASGQFIAGTPLTAGISKSVSWWTPDNKREYSGLLWEIEPVEVVARQRPANTAMPALPAPEGNVLAEEHVDATELREWLKSRNLAMVVIRNQTSRDRGDRQQPFNLRVPGGVMTTSGNGRVYDISHFQVFQGNLVRAYDHYNKGRRPIAQPISVAENPQGASMPPGGVLIAEDGSSAAFVPARRALTWQTVDPGGNAIVRERVWVTLQPGEIRTCAGCHGENTRNQAGQGTPANKPIALRLLLRHWKAQQAGSRRANGSQPLAPQ